MRRCSCASDIARLGIAPLTSMYWYSETSEAPAIDWRPEVHDSDGLAMWNGAGERIWRPLNNPPQTIASAFRDKNPRGFGLLQRDREFRPLPGRRLLRAASQRCGSNRPATGAKARCN